jgi:superfamily II DNA or RNA helicase
MQLYPHQKLLSDEIDTAWMLGATNIMPTMDCGGGKTALCCYKLSECPDSCVAIAHRQELVSQWSMTLARYGITHRIIGPIAVIKWIISLHAQTYGRDFYDPNARRAVAGVDTLISWSKPESRHYDSITRWGKQVKLWVVDEGHHLLRENKWGKAVELFPNARGLAPTATAERADGKGLGRHNDGLIDVMVEGARGRWLIDNGYLTDYRVFCPPSDLHLESVAHGADGDYVRKQLATATRSSSIMGDVVTHYRKLADGRLGVTFAPDVETATELAAGFNRAGVPAEVVSAKTPDKQRVVVMQQFAAGKILQVVNVDLFGEGFDLPAIEVVSMARATDSYGLYHQQFMRALRQKEGKDRAIIIDHVGNVIRHGLPDSPRAYSLERREKRSGNKQTDAIPLRVCLNPVCMSPYEAVYPACPFCGWVPVPQSRTSPSFVDGDLHELDEATLAAMRGEVERVDRPASEILAAMQPIHGYVIAKSITNKHCDRQEAQAALREAIAWYGGVRRAAGDADSVSYRRFYHTFGTDVLTAQALGRADAEELAGRINRSIGRVV